MSRLTQQIKAVERDLDKNNRIIRHQEAQLLHYICAKQLLIIGLIGSFFVGYFFARKKTMAQLIKLTLRLVGKIEKLYASFIYVRKIL